MDHLTTWFHNEEKRKKERQKANQILMINGDLQRLLHQSVKRIGKDNEAIQLEKELVERFQVVQSNLWNLRYLNNYESLSVAKAQIILIEHILNKKKPTAATLKNELKRLKFRASNLTF